MRDCIGIGIGIGIGCERSRRPGARVTGPGEARLLLDRADELAGHSSMPGGIRRTYLSAEHRAVNDLVAEWMRSAGLEPRVDAAGNLCGRVEGREPGLPALLLGSHLDTVPDAGRYDGILGVLTAIAVVQRLVDAGETARLPFALEVIAFADEEGTRFGATLLGSRAVAGTWDPAWGGLRDADGIALADAASAFGLDPDRIADAARRPDELVGYLELHIEQGPRLQEAGRALGIVSAIAAARRFTLQLVGEARHCATPFDRRRDALTGAAEAVLGIERISRELNAPATVGRIDAHPGAVNVIPGRVKFSLDLRAETDAARESAWDAIRDELARIALRRGLTLEEHTVHLAPEVACSPRMRAAIRAGIETAGESDPPELLSIAGHDAMAMAAVTEVGMVFVRCLDGISHHPDESVTETDAALGLDALTAAVRALAADAA